MSTSAPYVRRLSEAAESGVVHARLNVLADAVHVQLMWLHHLRHHGPRLCQVARAKQLQLRRAGQRPGQFAFGKLPFAIFTSVALI